MAGLSNELSPEDIETLRQAKLAQRQLRNMGLASNEPASPAKSKKLVEDAPQKPITKVRADIQSQPSIAPASQEVTAYDNFVEVGNLPSKGIFYRNPLMAQALKLEDLLQIESIDEGNIQPRFTEIFGRRVRNVHAEEILVADELYVAMWLRATSFPGYSFPADGFICKNEKCEFEMFDPEYGFNFSQITWEANELPEVVAEKFKEFGYYPIKLRSGKTVGAHIRRRYHEGQIHSVLHEDYYSHGLIPDDYTRKLLKIASILDLGDEYSDIKDDLREKAKIMREWSALDLLDIVKGTNECAFTVVPIVNHICPKCGEVTPLKGYPFHPALYIPQSP